MARKGYFNHEGKKPKQVSAAQQQLDLREEQLSKLRGKTIKVWLDPKSLETGLDLFELPLPLSFYATFLDQYSHFFMFSMPGGEIKYVRTSWIGVLELVDSENDNLFDLY